MPLGEPHRPKLWAGVILFFGIGAAIARTVALRMIDEGSSVFSAIAMGSCAGGYGAWFVFYVAANTVKWMTASRRSAGA